MKILRIAILPLGLFGLFTLLTAAGNGERSWQVPGQAALTGRVSAVFGDRVLVAGKKQSGLFPLQSLSEEELETIADFLLKPAPPATWQDSDQAVTKVLRTRLVELREGVLKPVRPAGPEPRIYLIYFSAGWCGPCHRFTPSLVEAYRKWQVDFPGEVEVIFVSSDEDAFAQEKYAKQMGMPWKILRYGAVGNTSVVEKWKGSGIPCLVALTPGGDLLLHTYQGEEYLGPTTVLEQSSKLLSASGEGSTEIKRRRHRLEVLLALRRAGGGEARIQPYLTTLDPRQYHTLEISEVPIQLEVDERGHVQDVTVAADISSILKDNFRRDLTEWLFLPAIENGRPVRKQITVPVRIEKATTAAAR